jgi:bifunctional DNA-binding transcriptional regulator/antitoxin component of YhaV-PrlF toxin-antitoxin module
VTIPIEVREKLGLLPNTEVEFEIRGNSARLVKARTRKAAGRGGDAVARLRGAASVKMSTDSILALTRGGRNGPRNGPRTGARTNPR